MGEVIAEPWVTDARYATLAGRLEHEDELDAIMTTWTRREPSRRRGADQAVGVPASAVAKPEERIDPDPGTSAWGLWPVAHHTRDG